MNADREAKEIVEVTRQLIAAGSENPPGNETHVIQVITGLLKERGIERVSTAAALPHRPNLIARIGDDKHGQTLILCGHVDTKPAGTRQAWKNDPFAGTIDDGRLYGLGACDMKGGVAAIIVALARLQHSAAARRGSVIAVFTADEEAGSVYGAKFLAHSALLQADAAIIAEPAGIDTDWQHLFVGTRGSLLFRVDIEGTGGHSSLEDHHPGMSATIAMAHLMTRLDTAFRQLPGVAVNVGATVEGGLHYAVRPRIASFRGDVRVPPAVALAEAREVLTNTVNGFVAETDRVSATVVLDEISDGPFDPLSVPEASPIVQACRAATKTTLGRLPSDSIFPGGTDSFFTQGLAGIPTVPALGPGCLREAHQPNEYVSLDSLTVAPELLTAAAQLYLE